MGFNNSFKEVKKAEPAKAEPKVTESGPTSMKLRFKGIVRYKGYEKIGEGFRPLNVPTGETVEVGLEKGHQLLADFPTDWEILNKNHLDFVRNQGFKPAFSNP